MQATPLCDCRLMCGAHVARCPSALGARINMTCTVNLLMRTHRCSHTVTTPKGETTGGDSLKDCQTPQRERPKSMSPHQFAAFGRSRICPRGALSAAAAEGRFSGGSCSSCSAARPAPRAHGVGALPACLNHTPHMFFSLEHSNPRSAQSEARPLASLSLGVSPLHTAAVPPKDEPGGRVTDSVHAHDLSARHHKKKAFKLYFCAIHG